MGEKHRYLINEPTDALDFNKAIKSTFTGNNVFDHYKIE